MLAQGKGSNDELREKFTQFVGEAFYGQMIKAMRSTVGKPAYFHGGRAEEVFKGQLDQTMAEQLTKTTRLEVRRPDVRAAVSAVGRDEAAVERFGSTLAAAAAIMQITDGRTACGACLHTMNDNWESEIGGLLAELADVQTALLGTLSEKRQMLAAGDQAALSAMAGREQELADGCKHATSDGSNCSRGQMPKGCRPIAFSR